MVVVTNGDDDVFVLFLFLRGLRLRRRVVDGLFAVDDDVVLDIFCFFCGGSCISFLLLLSLFELLISISFSSVSLSLLS